MNTPIPQRKARNYFDTDNHPNHVTFDDGKVVRRNLPWSCFGEAVWEYAEPDSIKVKIGDWLILLEGQNLQPLFSAIEAHQLLRVRAQPHLSEQREHELDCFVTDLQFFKVQSPAQGKQLKQGELDLGL